MTREAVIIEQLSVQRIGHRVYFQVKLPKDTRRIIGLEFGVMERSGQPVAGFTPPTPAEEPGYLKLVSNKEIGRITLQVAGEENVFFQHSITEERNIVFAEINAHPNGQPQLWTHVRKREEWQVMVDEDTIVEGFYQDRWGFGEFIWHSYKLHVYVWIEKCIL